MRFSAAIDLSLFCEITFSTAPIARIAACGGFTIAWNDCIPNMPRFEMDIVPPLYSCGVSFPARAFSIKKCSSCASIWNGFLAASLIIGVIKPPGMATATATSTLRNCFKPSFCQATFASLLRSSASARALTSRSFIEIFRGGL